MSTFKLVNPHTLKYITTPTGKIQTIKEGSPLWKRFEGCLIIIGDMAFLMSGNFASPSARPVSPVGAGKKKPSNVNPKLPLPPGLPGVNGPGARQRATEPSRQMLPDGPPPVNLDFRPAVHNLLMVPSAPPAQPNERGITIFHQNIPTVPAAELNPTLPVVTWSRQADFPKTYPFYVKTWIKDLDGNVSRIRKQYVKIQNLSQMRGFIDKTIRDATVIESPYPERAYRPIGTGNGTSAAERSTRAAARTSLQVHHSVVKPAGRQPVINVAKYELGNCVLAILQHAGIQCDCVYNKYPHLRATTTKDQTLEPIFINADELSTVAKLLKLNITVYTKLGAKLGFTWQTLGYEKSRRFHLEFSDGHAQVIPGRIRPTRIVYVNPDEIDPVSAGCDVIDSDIYPPCLPIPGFEPVETVVRYKYYTRMITRADAPADVPLYKSYRPSTVTRNPDDDADMQYRYVFSNDQLLFKLFKSKYGLEPIQDPLIKSVIKRAEHFIGRAVLEPLTRDQHMETDMNKCYAAYEYNPYYTGFPMTDFIPTRTLDGINSTLNGLSATLNGLSATLEPAFVVCKSIANVPISFSHLLGYVDPNPIVIIYPMYQYLLSVGARPDVDYYIMAKMGHVDIIGFGITYGNIGSDDLKLFRNKLIGRCIAGGLAETKRMTIKTSYKAELDQLIHECDEHGLTFDINDDIITIDYKQSTAGLFHFHGYVLGYAAISVMSKWDELEKAGCTISGFNVDALLYRRGTGLALGRNPLSTDAIGGWKIKSPSEYYYTYDVTGLPMAPSHIALPVIRIPDRPVPLRDTLIVGAAGVGKTRPWKLDPAHDQIMLAPTILLREDIRKSFPDTYTVHKYFQFGVSDEQWKLLRLCGKIPREYKYVVIDEYMMLNSVQWDTILRRRGNSIIVALGDPYQICNEIEAQAVDLEYFREKGFDIKCIERHGDARHGLMEGQLLDKLRDHELTTYECLEILDGQVSRCVDVDPSELISANTYNHYIADNHREVSMVNLRVKKYCMEHKLTIPVRARKKGIMTRVPVDHPRIWWGRTRMTDQIPKKLVFEPCIAITPDSIQGQTFDTRLYVSANIKRKGAFYTAVTRTRTLADVVVVGSAA